MPRLRAATQHPAAIIGRVRRAVRRHDTAKVRDLALLLRLSEDDVSWALDLLYARGDLQHRPGGPEPRADDSELDALRPKTRSDCKDGLRPCPFASCRHNLYLDVNRNGAIKINFPGLDITEIPESCALDVADRGGVTLDEIGQMSSISRERVRQLESLVLIKLKRLIVKIHAEGES